MHSSFQFSVLGPSIGPLRWAAFMVMAGQEKWATVAVSFFPFWLACQVYCVCAATSSKWLEQDTDSNADANTDTVPKEEAFHIHRSASRRGNDAEKKKVYCGLYKNTHLGWFPFQNVHTKNILEGRWHKVGGQSEWAWVEWGRRLRRSNDFVWCPFYLPAAWCAELSSATAQQGCQACQGCHYLGFALMGFCVRLMKPRWRRNG